MAGFEWDKFYTLFKKDMGNEFTVGRYKQPKESEYPYLDINLSDNTGGHYDLGNCESSQTPMIEVTAYCNNYDDSKCYKASMKAKKVMVSYGFQCITNPIKVDNADPAIARWVSRYKRLFGSLDEIKKVN